MKFGTFDYNTLMEILKYNPTKIVELFFNYSMLVKYLYNL